MLLVAVVACDTTRPSASAPGVVTVAPQSAVYEPGETVVLEVTNGTDQAIFVSDCDAVLERSVGAAWRYVDQRGCLHFPPDRSPPPTASARGCTAAVRVERFTERAEPGVYRIRLYLVTMDGAVLSDTAQSPLAFRISTRP